MNEDYELNIKKIYIIDDDLEFAKGLSDYFEDSGYKVIIISDEFKGLELIDEQLPDIVFLDLGLKSVNGIHILNQIKNKYKFLPVIIISGTDVMHEAVEAIKQGADDFISKPIFELRELEICVEKAFAKNILQNELENYKINLENMIDIRTRELNKKTWDLELANKSLIEEIEKRKTAEEYIKRGSLNIINALEDERKRLSFDLHDSIGQKLTYAKINLEMYIKELTQDKTKIINAIESITQMGEEIRMIIKSLYPQSIDKYPLIDNLTTLINNFEKLSNVKYSFQINGQEININPKMKLSIYRIFQEALNNINKHSSAKEVKIIIDLSDSQFYAAISDNGIGYRIDQSISEQLGTGLFSMNERAKQLNGQVQFSSVLGKGSTIIIEIPFKSL